MKKYILYLIPLLVTMGCDDYFDYDLSSYYPSLTSNYLFLRTTTLTIEGEASTEIISVQAEATPWTFKGMAPWLSLSPISGSEDTDVMVSASANPSGDNIRTSVFYLVTTDADVPLSFPVSLTQLQSTPYLTASPSDISFPAGRSSRTVRVESNVSWSINQESWLTISVAADSLSLTVTASENTTSAERKATLYFRSNSNQTLGTLTITQSVPAKPTTSPESLDFEQAGGSYALSITSDVAWTASTEASWIEVSPASGGAGTSKLTISTTANPTERERKGNVEFAIGGVKVTTIEVRQKCLYVKADSSSVTFKAQGESKLLSINSNVAWTILSKPDWITTSVNSGNGQSSMTLRAEEYWGSTDRKGVLKLGVEGTEVTASVALLQKGRYIDDIPPLTFDAAVGTRSFAISTDGKWTASVAEKDESWLKVSPSSGTGKANLQVTVTENKDDDERTGEIRVTVGTTTKSVFVLQSGKYFTVSPGTFAELPSKGGSHTVHIASDDSWTAKNSSAWMKLSKTSGTGNIDVTMTAPDHPSITPRNDTTTFTPTYAQPVRVITRQAGRYLTVDVTSVRFFAKGGTSDAVEISTDATYAITTSDSWFTVSRKGNTFTVTASENTTGERREGTIIITMQGLNEGEKYILEVPVVQKSQTSGVEVDPFGSDHQWELNAGGAAVIRVTGYTADKNWDASTSSGIKVIVKTFTDDQNWN